MAIVVINGKKYKLEDKLEVKNGMILIDGFEISELDNLEKIFKDNGIKD